MSTVLVDIQQAVYTLLNADATLTATLGASIYDNVPDNSDYPYVQVGDDQIDDWSSHTFDGFEGRITIHTWTQGRGRKTCKQIQDRIYTLLHEADLSISDQKTVSLRTGLTTTILDPDGRTYHGVSQFDFLLGGA